MIQNTDIKLSYFKFTLIRVTTFEVRGYVTFGFKHESAYIIISCIIYEYKILFVTKLSNV